MFNHRTGAPADRSPRARHGRGSGLEAATATLARIGVSLGAQGAELFSAVDHEHVRLDSRWAMAALGDDRCPVVRDVLPLSWFPWGLGMIKPNEYVFVQNAGPLPADRDGIATLRDLSIGSTLHIPLVESGQLRGALCVMWADERETWSTEDYGRVCELALSALDVSTGGTTT